MAATGATPISLYYTTTASAAPTAGNLVNGELAINITDGKIFYKDNAGVVQVIAGKGGAGVAGGSNTQVQYNSSGSLAGSANMTFNGTTLTLANDASISGLTVGKGGGALTSNTAVGLGAGSLNTSGARNAFFGQYAAYANTSGADNSAFGANALNANTTASGNSSFGSSSLGVNTTGANNTAVGNYSLASNTTANYNTAVGYQTGYTNTTGRIDAFGTYVLQANTTGVSNVGMGGSQIDSISSALRSNTTGSYNTGIGMGALGSNTTASNNTAVGYQAGYTSSTSNNSTYVGFGAGYSATGPANTAVGKFSGYSVTGNSNTFIGFNDTANQGSGYYITSGSKNSILGPYNGNQGGLDIRTASNYIVLSDGDGNPRGYWTNSGVQYSTANASSDEAMYLTNSSATNPYGLQIGFSGATPNNTTQHFLVCSDPTNIKCYIYSSGTISNRTGTYNTISDAKLKENIVDASPKLDKLMQVKVRNYNLIGDELKQIGFVAQELEQVFPALVEDCPDTEKGEDGKYVDLGTITKNVKSSVMIPILVKAIQELKAEVDSLKQQLGK